MSYQEQKQYLRDLSYIRAEKDFLNMQDFIEEMDRERKPAKIMIVEEKLAEEEELTA